MNSDEFTIKEKMIPVGDGHTIYAQLWGSPKAKDTVLFLHGGPGSGCSDKHKSLFDPQIQRVLFFDQRGSGKSTPKGELKNNTTKDLVNDIELLAKIFEIDSFIVTGGSWGSTLALVLAIEKPELVKALVVRGIYTARQSETDFMTDGSIGAFFPDVWEKYAMSVPEEFRDDPSRYHMDRMLGDDQDAAKESAYQYDLLELGIAKLDDRNVPSDFQTYDKVPITLEVSYTDNGSFLEEGYILNNASKIKAPLYIIQGRYDMVCPPVTAYELHKAVPGSKLTMTQAGHSGDDKNNWEVTKSILALVAE